MVAGGKRSAAEQRANAVAGMAAAVAWRESRRCPDCRALAYVPCSHWPNGLEVATLGEMAGRGSGREAPSAAVNHQVALHDSGVK
jgi:hypothetical protein